MNNKSHKRFVYDFSKKRQTIVEFDIGFLNGEKVAKNIKLTSNWRANYPKAPIIAKNGRGENGFSENGIHITNGDIQQMIMRIENILYLS